MRRVFGCPKYIPVPYDWIISRDGKDLGRLHDPEWVDMFWRRPILTPTASTPAGVNLFDDGYWADCKYQVRHASLRLDAPHVLIRATGEPPRVSVRGVPERLPEHEWPMNRGVEP